MMHAVRKGFFSFRWSCEESKISITNERSDEYRQFSINEIINGKVRIGVITFTFHESLWWYSESAIKTLYNEFPLKNESSLKSPNFQSRRKNRTTTKRLYMGYLFRSLKFGQNIGDRKHNVSNDFQVTNKPPPGIPFIEVCEPGWPNSDNTCSMASHIMACAQIAQ